MVVAANSNSQIVEQGENEEKTLLRLDICIIHYYFVNTFFQLHIKQSQLYFVDIKPSSKKGDIYILFVDLPVVVAVVVLHLCACWLDNLGIGLP